MNDKRLGAAFGEPPASFEEAMMKAIVDYKESGKRRFGARELLIAAAIIALLCGAAYAAVRGFGLLDLLTQAQPVLPEATELVQEEIEQTGGDLPDVKFTLEQVISDGRQIYFTLRATPKRPDEVMLADTDDWGSTDKSIDHWRTDIPWNEKSAVTFEQLAEQQGKQLLYAYMISARIGEADRSPIVSQPGLAYDGDDIVYVYSVQCDAQPGEMIDLKLLLQQYDPVIGEEDTEHRGTLTARVALTSDVTHYNWDTPVDIPDLGVTINQLYVSATSMGLQTYVHYGPIEGADEVTVRDVRDLNLEFVDDAGQLIRPVAIGNGDLNNISYTRDGGYLMLKALPAMQPFTGLNIAFQDDMTGLYKPGDDGALRVIRFDVKDARPDPDGSAMPQREETVHYIEVSGPYAHPTAEVTLGDGTPIPLLRNFDTQYSGIADAVEQLAADVNLSVTYGGFTLTIDQIAATDGYIWLSYTLKGDEPLSTNRWDVSADAPRFSGVLDGDYTDGAELGSPDAAQAFSPDPYTLMGWARLQSGYTPHIIPEKFRLSLWTGGFADIQFSPGKYSTTIDDYPFGFEISVDRSRATQGVRSIPTDVRFKLGQREFNVVNVSISPLGGIMVLDETLRGGQSTSYQFILTDENGDSLTVDAPSFVGRSAPGGRNKRVTVRHALQFVGGFDAQSLRLIPYTAHNKKSPRVLMPIDQALPFTATFSDGVYVTVEDIQLDTNGMAINYRTTAESVYFTPMSGEGADDQWAGRVDYYRGELLDRATGSFTDRFIWRVERGAAAGETIKPETLEQIRYIEIDVNDATLRMDRSVVIPLNP